MCTATECLTPVSNVDMLCVPSYQLNCLNLESMTVMHTIKVPDVDIVGLAANEHSGDLWILTKTSLFKISEHSQLQNE